MPFLDITCIIKVLPHRILLKKQWFIIICDNVITPVQRIQRGIPIPSDYLPQVQHNTSNKPKVQHNTSNKPQNDSHPFTRAINQTKHKKATMSQALSSFTYYSRSTTHLHRGAARRPYALPPPPRCTGAPLYMNPSSVLRYEMGAAPSVVAGIPPNPLPSP